jgi:hypothetical protein
LGNLERHNVLGLSAERTGGREVDDDQTIAARDGDTRAAARGRERFSGIEIAELMKAISHAYARGRFLKHRTSFRS